jgi:glycosidase
MVAMRKKLCIATFISIFWVGFSFAQYADVYPTNWWVGMKNNKVQLLIKSADSSLYKSVVTIKYPGITLGKVSTFENGKYLAVDITIGATAKPGNVKINLNNNGATNTISWPLAARRKGNGSSFAQGVTSADFIYLLMPDRFSNGNTGNDRIAGMRDQSLSRDSLFTRHGGDLQGVINHLDYLQSLGVTTLWMTPVLENDRTERTEHGYGFTDQYKIDARLGGADAYKSLSDALHQRGMKLIQDAVYNHVDIDHFLVKEPPSKDWLHQWPNYTGTNYKDQPIFDPYGAAADKKITTDGWFTPLMPDVNQGNPFMANFLIQNAIWSVETFGVDGWRIDTYLYNDLGFMNKCNKALMDEYPKITMFGETWVHGTVSQAYMVDNTMKLPFKSNLQGVTDFQTNLYGIIPALTQNFGWTEGVNKLYTTLANDIVYTNPMRNVNFLDNHDLSRFFSIVGENVEKQKTGIMWLFTCRGIPQMYYGTEILMKGFTNPDGWVRLDFPGGWQGDSKNAFTGQGLTDDEKSVQELVKTLGNYRKHASALQTGKMMQYVPQDGLYVYFRYDAQQTIMCIMNTDQKDRDIDFTKYAERTNGFSKAESVVSNIIYNIKDQPIIPASSMWVLELKQ